MIDIRKYKANVLAAAAVAASIAAAAVWQFRLFVLSQGSQGMADVSGGSHHLWWAVGGGLMACFVSFYTFSALVRYDKSNEMTII